MALNKIRLRDQLYNTLLKGIKEDSTPEKAFLFIATELSNIIDDYIRSADVVGIDTEVNATLESDIDLAVEGEVFEGIPISGKGLAAHGPIIVMGETAERGKVLGKASGKQINKLKGPCVQKGVGKLE